MKLSLESKPYLGLVVCLMLGAFLLFYGLGRFGMWEPQEIGYAESAEKLHLGQELPGTGGHIEERLAALSWKLLGKSELTGRLPIAALALLAILAMFLFLSPIAGPNMATLASLVFASAPILLFHGRQLTGGMPVILGEVLSILGLAYALQCRRVLRAAVGIAMGIAGLLLGWLSSDLLVGVTAPLGIVTVSRMISAPLWPFARSDETVSRDQGVMCLVLGSLALLSLGTFLSVVFLSETDIPLITGGMTHTAHYNWSFDFAFEQLVYGWFPWSAFAPICVMGFFQSANQDDKKLILARSLVVTGIPIGFLAHATSLEFSGLSPCLVTLPMALATALAIHDVARSEVPMRLLGLIGVCMIALMARDFFEEPVKILTGYGFEKLAVPKKDYMPIIKATAFSLPAVFLMMASFLAPGRWRTWQVRLLAPLAPVTFGAFISLSLVPGFSVHLSPKHAVEAYERFRKGNEPLAVFGSSRFFSNEKILESQEAVIDWLNRKDRVFALFPPTYLAGLDRQMRDRNGKNIFVLDAESDRFFVATSKPKSREKNKNPIAEYTRSVPFKPGPKHQLSVNFDDKITLLGWSIESPAGEDRMAKGKEFTFTTYWHVEEVIPGTYKMFMHIDGPGGRLHGDHDPFEGKFPTSQWAKGDYIREVYRKEVPLYQSSGEYRIRFGLFKESSGSRLRIKQTENVQENGLFLTKLMLD